jgi:hypothetical protein
VIPVATAPQPIINTILSDVNAVVPNFQALVASYRLLVGAAEEIHRIPNVPPDVYQRSIDRFDRTGTLIDIVNELLFCKICFSSEFLSVTCAPVDLFRLLSNSSDAADTPHRTAEQILQLEALRRALGKTNRNRTDSSMSKESNRQPEHKAAAEQSTSPISQSSTEADQEPPPFSPS